MQTENTPGEERPTVEWYEKRCQWYQQRLREVEGEREAWQETARLNQENVDYQYGLRIQAEQRLEQMIVQMIVQMAGVSTVAMGWGLDTPAKDGDYGWSVPYEDVLKLRREFNEAEQRVAALEKELERHRGA